MVLIPDFVLSQKIAKLSILQPYSPFLGSSNQPPLRSIHGILWVPTIDNRWTPLLTDPATIGVLLSLARKVYKDPYLRVRYSESNLKWEVIFGGQHSKTGDEPSGETEGEAIINALLIYESQIQ